MQQKRVAVLGGGGEMEGAAALRGSENREGRRTNRSRAEQMSLRNRNVSNGLDSPLTTPAIQTWHVSSKMASFR